MSGTDAVKEENENCRQRVGRRQDDLRPSRPPPLSSGTSQLVPRPLAASLPLCGSRALSIRCFLAGSDGIGSSGPCTPIFREALTSFTKRALYESPDHIF